LENGKRVAARLLGVPFLFLGRKKKRFQHRGLGEEEAGLKDQRYMKECREKKNTHPEKRRVRHPRFDPLPHLLPLVRLLQFLLVFLVDVEDGAVFVEGYVEGFGLLD
jgi:hypothetical protein